MQDGRFKSVDMRGVNVTEAKFINLQPMLESILELTTLAWTVRYVMGHFGVVLYRLVQNLLSEDEFYRIYSIKRPPPPPRLSAALN